MRYVRQLYLFSFKINFIFPRFSFFMLIDCDLSNESMNWWRFYPTPGPRWIRCVQDPFKIMVNFFFHLSLQKFNQWKRNMTGKIWLCIYGKLRTYTFLFIAYSILLFSKIIFFTPSLIFMCSIYLLTSILILIWQIKCYSI